jgi:hypothetical protein
VRRGVGAKLARSADAQRLTLVRSLVERTLALSLELQEVSGVKRRLETLDQSLKQYERLADQLLVQQQRKRSSSR